MKYLTQIFIFCYAATAWSQDTVKLKSGTQEIVIVVEISLTELSYRNFSNLDGPLYKIPKSEIEYVRYKNGDREFFLELPIAEKEEIKSNSELIRINGYVLYQHDHKISDRYLYKLAQSLPTNEKKWRMNQKYNEMQEYKKRQYLLHTFGLIFTIASPVAALVLLTERQQDPMFLTY